MQIVTHLLSDGFIRRVLSVDSELRAALPRWTKQAACLLFWSLLSIVCGCTYMCMHACVCVHVHVCMRTSVCACVRICMCVDVHGQGVGNVSHSISRGDCSSH